MNIEMVKKLIYRKSELANKNVHCIESGDFTKFYYGIGADFNDEEVRLCRGVTFYKDKIVACPFFKFGNYGESYADKIDWASAQVQEKIDGSLISLWFNPEIQDWTVSTNKNIFAYGANVGMCAPEISSSHFATFASLFWYAAEKQGLNVDKLCPNFTYIFELTSPYNKIIIPYNEISIWHIGTRNNITLKEIDKDIGIKQPARYPLRSLEDCINAAAALGEDKEGFVVVDKNFNRIKVKSPAYFRLHHLHNNGNLSFASAIELIFSGEDEEYLSYFPEQTETINFYKGKLKALEEELEQSILTIPEAYQPDMPRNEAAKLIKTLPYPAFGFMRLKDSISAAHYIKTMKISALKKIILLGAKNE